MEQYYVYFIQSQKRLVVLPQKSEDQDYLHLIDSNSKEIYENQIPVRMKGIEREEFQTYLIFKLAWLSPN